MTACGDCREMVAKMLKKLLLKTQIQKELVLVSTLFFTLTIIIS